MAKTIAQLEDDIAALDKKRQQLKQEYQQKLEEAAKEEVNAAFATIHKYLNAGVSAEPIANGVRSLAQSIGLEIAGRRGRKPKSDNSSRSTKAQSKFDSAKLKKWLANQKETLTKKDMVAAAGLDPKTQTLDSIQWKKFKDENHIVEVEGTKGAGAKFQVKKSR